MASRANYCLSQGTHACLLEAAPLMAILSAVSRWYCGRALCGLYSLRIMVYRAPIGLALAVISVGLHYPKLSELLSKIITFL